MRFFKKNNEATSPKDTTDNKADTPPTQKDLKSAWEDFDAKEQARKVTTPASNIASGSFLGNTTTDYKDPEFKARTSGGSDNHIDVTPDEAPVAMAPTTYTRDKGADLNAMRLDVARISADIQSGEELYRRAQKRIDNLTGFVERAEVDFSLLNRLEPENRRLKARIRTLESEFDDKTRQIRLLEAQVEDTNTRLLERNKAFDESQSRLALTKTALRDYERSLKTAQDSSDRNALAAERAETSLDVEKRENEVLRNKLVEVTVSAEEKQSGYIEAKKMADSLMQDCEDYRNRAELSGSEVMELRNALDEAKRQNAHMKGEMVQLHEDIRSFKTEYEFNLVAREDEIISQQTQIDTLQKQLDVKDEIVRNAARDVTELRKIRTAQDLERERLESLLETQNYQLDDTRSQLMKTQQDVSDFDRRYRDVATALTVSQARRANNPPAETPDIQPRQEATRSETQQDVLSDEPPFPSNKAVEDKEEVLSDDEIMSRVTDFKLGNRSEIT